MFKFWFERLQHLFTAVTFAEAGDPETARKYLELRPAASRPAAHTEAVLASRTRRAPAH